MQVGEGNILSQSWRLDAEKRPTHGSELDGNTLIQSLRKSESGTTVITSPPYPGRKELRHREVE